MKKYELVIQLVDDEIGAKGEYCSLLESENAAQAYLERNFLSDTGVALKVVSVKKI